MERPGDVLGERYRLVAPAGSRGLSRVWDGYDEVLRCPVTVHLVEAPAGDDPRSFALDLRQEVTAAAGLRHPGMIAVRDLGRTGEGHFVVCEWVDAAPAGRLSWGDVTQVAQVVLAAHRAGIVHGGIGAETVLRDRSGAVRVADFGIATMAGRRPWPLDVPVPAFISPDRLRGAPGPQVDVSAILELMRPLTAGTPEELVGRRPTSNDLVEWLVGR